MGKKRIAIISGQEQTTAPAKSAISKGKKIKEATVIKLGKGDQGKLADMSALALAELEKVKEVEKKVEKQKAALKKEPTRKIKVKIRSRAYQQAKKLIDSQKLYSPKDAIELLKKTSHSKFNGTVEVNINTIETGTLGSAKFPYPIGKSKKIQIADDKVIDDISKGKIDFDILLATPGQMPHLAKYAKFLGPRGLMPNPKNQTITQNPEARKKELEKEKTPLKTEKQFPLIHLIIGKIQQPEKELVANLEALLEALPPTKIEKITICSTMSPSIKVAFSQTTKP
jgi:large subunit ribosomal protein L1